MVRGLACWRPGKAPRWSFSSGIAEAIEVARLLHELPAHLLVYGIEGASFAAEAPLSKAVEHVIPAVLSQVQHDIATITTADV
jgi:hypothetical protein